MTVYEIIVNPGQRYQQLEFDHQASLSRREALPFGGQAMTFDGVLVEEWGCPVVMASDNAKPRPDFWSIKGVSGAFAIGDSAFEKVSALLELAGQSLPIRLVDAELQICNILECIDCIDERLSEWKRGSNGERIEVIRPYFQYYDIGPSTLFKIPQKAASIYAWEEHKDPDDEFKACVEEYKLTGLEFRAVWSESNGIIN